MKFDYVAVAAPAVLALGATIAMGQASKAPSETDARFAKEWAEVRTKYPAVAIAYARRDAFVSTAGVTKDICALYNVLGLTPPSGCGLSFPPLGNIGDCFKPKPTAERTYEMPDADEAAACVRNALKPRTR